MRSLTYTTLAIILAGCGGTEVEVPQSGGYTKKQIEIGAPFLSDRDATQIVVFLPPDYPQDDVRRFPVVYFLHGWGSDAGAFERLGGEKEISRIAHDKAMIVVSVSGDTSGYRNWADGKSLWEDHLTKTVVGYVDSEFRTRPDAKSRAVYGVSMGGSAAIRMAMLNQKSFSCAAAHSAAISPVEFNELPDWQREGYLQMSDFADRYGNPFDADNWRNDNPLHLAQSLESEDLLQGSYYFDVGTDDHLGFADDNAALSQTLAARSIPHVFALRPGGHGGEFVTVNMTHALEFLSACFARE